jgi:hypothetical protein
MFGRWRYFLGVDTGYSLFLTVAYSGLRSAESSAPLTNVCHPKLESALTSSSLTVQIWTLHIGQIKP